MNLNLTLFGQMITFIVFIWITMQYVWPHVMQALEDRQAKIAEGLAAAERGQHDLQLAQEKVVDQLRQAKEKSAEIIDAARKRAEQLVTEAQHKAREEGLRLLASAQDEIERQEGLAKKALHQQIASIAVLGAEKILNKNIDQAANSELVDELIKDL